MPPGLLPRLRSKTDVRECGPTLDLALGSCPIQPDQSVNSQHRPHGAHLNGEILAAPIAHPMIRESRTGNHARSITSQPEPVRFHPVLLFKKTDVLRHGILQVTRWLPTEKSWFYPAKIRSTNSRFSSTSTPVTLSTGSPHPFSRRRNELEYPADAPAGIVCRHVQGNFFRTVILSAWPDSTNALTPGYPPVRRPHSGRIQPAAWSAQKTNPCPQQQRRCYWQKRRRNMTRNLRLGQRVPLHHPAQSSPPYGSRRKGQ